MTNTPNPGNEPEPNQDRIQRRRPWVVLLTRTTLGLSLLLMVGGGGVALWAWVWIHQQLAPLVETNLSQTLQRPVQLGEVENFNFRGLRFGASSVPATPNDPDYASVPAVDVAFDPIKLLLTRTLQLNITLVKPKVYLEQDDQGVWVSTTIKAGEEKGPITTDLQTIRVENANLVLLPRLKPGERNTQGQVAPPESAEQDNQQARQQKSSVKDFPASKPIVTFANVTGAASFFDQNQRITFEGQGQSITGGNFKIQGENRPATEATNLQLQGQNILAFEIDRLVQLPLDLQAGRIDGNLEVKLRPKENQQPSLLGVGTLRGVQAQVPQAPRPFSNTNGILRFQGTTIQLENVTTVYGQAPAVANGLVDTQAGYNLFAQIAPISLAKTLNTLNLKLPVASAGELRANLRLTGAIDQPVISGAAVTTKLTQLDRISFKNISGRFQLIGTKLAISNVQAFPALGGQVTGNGRVELTGETGFVFDGQARDLPGDSFAQIYGAKLDPVRIGTVQATAQVFGTPTKPQTVVSFQAPQATYPATGEVIVAGEQLFFRNTVLKVGKGTVNARGQVVDGRWQVAGAASGVELARLAQLSGSQGTPPIQGQLNGTFNLLGSTEAVQADKIIGTAQGSVNIAGGTVKANSVKLLGGQWLASGTASDLQLSRLSPQIPAQYRAQLTQGAFKLSGSLDSFQPETIFGTAEGNLRIAGGTVRAANVQLGGGRWRAAGTASNLLLNRLSPQLPTQFPTQLSQGAFNLSGSLANFQPETLAGNAQGILNVVGGTVRANNVQLGGGRWQVSGTASDVPLRGLSPQLSAAQAQLSQGAFNLSGSLANFQTETLVGNAQGRLNIGGGTLTATSVQLGNRQWRASLEANDVQLQRLSPQVPPQLRGPLDGAFFVSGSLASFGPETLTAQGEGTLNVADGRVRASNVQLFRGRWQALVDASQVQLSQFSDQLRGRLSGSVNVSGNLSASSIAGIQASGRLEAQNFSARQPQGTTSVDGPLTADISWDGRNLQIQRATAPGLEVNGLVVANAQAGVPQITSLNLNVIAQDYDLDTLPIALPNNLDVAGRIDYTGKVTGTLTAPSVSGGLQLEDFVVNGLAFDPVLNGDVNLATGSGGRLQLTGNQGDRIELALSPNYQPVSFLVQRDETRATGNKKGDQLLVDVKNFPLSVVRGFVPLNPLTSGQPFSGDLSGEFAVNLTNGELASVPTQIVARNVAITNPVFGNIKGDALTANFRYSNGAATLTDGVFRQGESLYALNASFTPTPAGPQFKAAATVTKGKVQDILTALQVFDIQDLTRGGNAPAYDKAEEIGPITPVGLPNAPLSAQLRRLSEIETLLSQVRAARDDSPLPELRDFTGIFGGEITVAGSPREGITANFNLGGEDWKWGRENSGRLYTVNQVTIKGGFENGILTLLPLRFESENSSLALTGTIGGEEQSAQLRARNIPVELLRQFVTLPASTDITGQLSATATLAGSINNPQALGEITLAEGSLNRTPIQAARSSFTYNNARLTFGSTLVVSETNPVTITGSIPYKLPFASVSPDNNVVSLDVDVEDEGLALLTLLSNSAVEWKDGEGEVRLKVRGNLDQDANQLNQLVAEGTATVQNATIKPQTLPDPLTNVNGQISFNFDTIQVQNLQGSYGGSQVLASGSIPILNPASADPEKPLIVNVGRENDKDKPLEVRLKGLYNGGVAGTVLVTGTALSPRLGGNIELTDGQVQLAQAGATDAATPVFSGEGTQAEDATTIGFNNLSLRLGPRVRVVSPPILEFLAEGDLTIGGTLDDLRPQGTIKLKRGQVNLFTTQFRLDRGYEQTATFTRDQRLDPTLDVRLVASVAEATRTRIPTNTLSGEITDVPATSLGAVQTVRIQARATGLASQLADNLLLTSNPSRSETEIVALLGGGFVETLGRGDSTLGLANLAGSALLSPIQNIVGDALGLSEFRLFPTLTSDRKGNSSTLGLAAEVGIDITPRFSTSILKILTDDQPAQLNVRYRINDEILLRGGTDFSEDTRGLVEYEKRF